MKRRSYYHFTPKSGNAKTGPMPVTTTSANSCPDCPMEKVCYAKGGPLAIHWRQVTEGNRGGTIDQLCDAIASLPDDQLWRHNQAGDLPGEHNRINSRELSKLVAANTGRRGFTYTHKPTTPHNSRQIKAANAAGFTINLSGNNPAHADTLAELDIGPVVVVLPINTPRRLRTPAGRPIVVCPATYRDDVTCSSCGACAVTNRKSIIGFPAHGANKRRANLIATQEISA